MPLDDPKRVLCFGTDAGLDLLHLIDHRVNRIDFDQCLTFARFNCNVPVHIGIGIWHLFNALRSHIAECICLLSMQQTVAFNDVVNIARCATKRVHQARLGIRSNVGLHAKVHLLALLA